MTAISKVIALCQTDGIANTAENLWRSFSSKLGLRVSETLFFRRELLHGWTEQEHDADLDCRVVTDASALESYAFERLKHVPYRRWFNSGSKCCLGLIEGRVVSYCWTHTGVYAIDRAVGTFVLKKNEAWVGPLFVDKRHRGRGISRLQIRYAIGEQFRAGTNVFFTATNFANYASIRSFVKCGFVMIGLSRIRSFGTRPISAVILDTSTSDYLREALT